MNALTSEGRTSVKVVGANGQVSLGKRYAGRQVLVEEREPGVWVVRIARVVPENEAWLHEPRAMADLQSALDWASRNKPQQTDVDALFRRLDDAKQTDKPASKTRSQPSRVSKKPA